MAQHATTGNRRRPSGKITALAVVVVALLAGGAAFLVLETSATSTPAHDLATSTQPKATATTASTAPTTTTTTTQPPGPGFNVGQVTAIGDSVMLDYQDPLKTSIPGINVDASVSRQWSAGESILQTLKADGQLGGDIIIGLGTNGPITDADFDNMMSIVGGASRVVFVNVHVDRSWQDPNNAVLASGATRYPNVVVADWATLAAQNPQWFGADGTHLAIDGAGADALASLIASTLSTG
jgi:lysophospholipase L1-like esterase